MFLSFIRDFFFLPRSEKFLFPQFVWILNICFYFFLLVSSGVLLINSVLLSITQFKKKHNFFFLQGIMCSGIYIAHCSSSANNCKFPCQVQTVSFHIYSKLLNFNAQLKNIKNLLFFFESLCMTAFNKYRNMLYIWLQDIY